MYVCVKVIVISEFFTFSVCFMRLGDGSVPIPVWLPFYPYYTFVGKMSKSSLTIVYCNVRVRSYHVRHLTLVTKTLARLPVDLIEYGRVLSFARRHHRLVITLVVFDSLTGATSAQAQQQDYLQVQTNRAEWQMHSYSDRPTQKAAPRKKAPDLPRYAPSSLTPQWLDREKRTVPRSCTERLSKQQSRWITREKGLRRRAPTAACRDLG